MSQLAIFLLLFSLARGHPHESSTATSKVRNSNVRAHKSQNHLGESTGEGGAAQIEIVSEEPEFEASGQNDNEKRSDLTLEQCYGKIGRWLGSKTGKKKQLKTKQKCCVCCGRPISGQNNKSFGYLVKGSEKLCAHIKAGSHNGCSNSGAGGESEILIKDAAKDSKISLKRSINAGSETKSGHALASGSGVVAGTAQRYRVPQHERRVIRRPARIIPNDGHTCICQMCCMEYCPESLYDCCGDCLILTFGGLAWIVDRGCRACCGLLCKGLEMCFKPCCG